MIHHVAQVSSHLYLPFQGPQLVPLFARAQHLSLPPGDLRDPSLPHETCLPALLGAFITGARERNSSSNTGRIVALLAIRNEGKVSLLNGPSDALTT